MASPDNAYAFWRHCRLRKGAVRCISLKDGTRAVKIFSKTVNNTGRSDRQARAPAADSLYLLRTNAPRPDRASPSRPPVRAGGKLHHACIPDWLGDWFFEELTYERRHGWQVAKHEWRRRKRGAGFTLPMLHGNDRGYERIQHWDNPPPRARLHISSSRPLNL